MEKQRVLVVGCGNVGRGVLAALRRCVDMEACGIASRSPARVRKEITDLPVVSADDVAAMHSLHPDVAILAGGSKNDLPLQGPCFARLFPTVDSFDNHSRIPDYFAAVDAAAREGGNVAVISAGWDPGYFSLQRTLAAAFLPGSRAYGFYGLGPRGGLSMGHSDALRTITGVADARQFTHAIPEAIDRVRRGENPEYQPGDMHTRECFVVLEEGADAKKVEAEIKAMPGYFAPYQTKVHFVTQAELDEKYQGFPHDGCVVAAGKTANGCAGAVEFRCQWESNPESTAEILVAHARAAIRLDHEGWTGAKTILDIPPAYFSLESQEELLKRFM